MQKGKKCIHILVPPRNCQCNSLKRDKNGTNQKTIQGLTSTIINLTSTIINLTTKQIQTEMKKRKVNSVCFFLVFAFVCYVSCDNKPKEEDKSFIIQLRKDEYDILKIIGEDRWGCFERYYYYVEVESNKGQLYKELEEKGYSLSALSLAMNNDFRYIFDSIDRYWFEPTDFNEDYLNWVYINMRRINLQH